MGLNAYIDLIDSERERRPSEARLVDEIRRLRLALEVIADCDCHAAETAEEALKASYSDITDRQPSPSGSGEDRAPGGDEP
jgi:hypothetical protein